MSDYKPNVWELKILRLVNAGSPCFSDRDEIDNWLNTLEAHRMVKGDFVSVDHGEVRSLHYAYRITLIGRRYLRALDAPK